MTKGMRSAEKTCILTDERIIIESKQFANQHRTDSDQLMKEKKTYIVKE